MFEFIKVDSSQLKDLRHSNEPTYVIKGKGSDEYWRSIKNGDHLVSTGGRIYSNPKKRLLKEFLDNGYQLVKIGKKPYSVARLVAEAFIDDVEGKEVHHIDGNRHNNIIKNLQVLSSSTHRKKPRKNKLKINQAVKRKLACPLAKLHPITFILVETFDSISAATIAMTGSLISKTAIQEASKCPDTKTAYGYRWLRLIEGLHYTISKKDGKIFDYDEAAIKKTIKEIKVKGTCQYGRKPVIGICRESPSGEVINKISFKSIAAAAKHLGISHSSVLDNIYGKSKCSKSKKDGTYWIFVLNENPE